MVILDQMKAELTAQRQTLDEVTASLDLDSRRKRIEELSREMEEPGFWDDADKANKKTRDLKVAQDLVETMERLSRQYDDIIELIDMTNGEGKDDPEMAQEIRGELDSFTEKLEEIRINNLLSGEYDSCNAILKLAAGAGGTEACDWCAMSSTSSCNSHSPDVHPLGREKGLYHRCSGLSGWGRGRYQDRILPGKRQQCLWAP